MERKHIVRARQTFAAPWGLSLKLLTALSVGILLSVPLIGLYSGPRHLFLWTSSMVLLPLLVLVGAAFFVIRGYTVSGQTLRIHRLGWDSTLDLQQLRSATVDPGGHATLASHVWEWRIVLFRWSFPKPETGAISRLCHGPEAGRGPHLCGPHGGGDAR